MDKSRIAKVLLSYTQPERCKCASSFNKHYCLEVDLPECFDLLPFDCANHALKVLGPLTFTMGENGGQCVNFDKHYWIVEEHLHVCWPSVVEKTKFNFHLHQCIPPGFFTTETVPLKLATHNIIDLHFRIETRR